MRPCTHPRNSTVAYLTALSDSLGNERAGEYSAALFRLHALPSPALSLCACPCLRRCACHSVPASAPSQRPPVAQSVPASVTSRTRAAAAGQEPRSLEAKPEKYPARPARHGEHPGSAGAAHPGRKAARERRSFCAAAASARSAGPARSDAGRGGGS